MVLEKILGALTENYRNFHSYDSNTHFMPD